MSRMLKYKQTINKSNGVKWKKKDERQKFNLELNLLLRMFSSVYKYRPKELRNNLLAIFSLN